MRVNPDLPHWRGLAAAFALLSALGAAACNTVEGAGQDIESLGSEIEETAEEVED